MQFTPQRIERVHRAMKSEDVEALVVTRRQDVRYLTGYESPTNTLPTGCVIIMNEQPQLVMSSLQHEALGQNSIMAQVHPIDDKPFDEWGLYRSAKFWDSVVKILEDSGIENGMIGLQQERLSVKEFEYLKTKIPGAGFKDLSSLLWRLRQVKDDAEIEAIRKAVKVAEIGIRTALEIIAPGKTEADASIEIEAAMRSAGGQLRGIRAAVLSGNRGRFPFAQPTANRIGKNEPVVIDVTVSESGYFAEVARTLHTGSPKESQQKAYDAVLRACKAAEDKMTAGAGVSDVYGRVAKKVGKKTPIGSFLQPLGNSIGLDLQEPPLMVSFSKASLREGMVLSLHPTYYHEGVGAAKIGDMFLITSDGYENLSTISRETM
ncbi:MAG: M24 family metallopeptidase [Promethearchaeota archaeon]